MTAQPVAKKQGNLDECVLNATREENPGTFHLAETVFPASDAARLKSGTDMSHHDRDEPLLMLVHKDGQRKGSRAPTEEGWNEIKPHFIKLYMDERNTLKNTMDQLRHEYDFKATEKMYKHHIKIWGLKKYSKDDELLRPQVRLDRRDHGPAKERPSTIEDAKRHLRRQSRRKKVETEDEVNESYDFDPIGSFAENGSPDHTSTDFQLKQYETWKNQHPDNTLTIDLQQFINNVIEADRAQPFAPTDSGYASMNSIKQARADTLEDTIWETKTMYSAASVETTRRDGVMHKIATRLFDDMGGTRFDESEATAISSRLPELFADFALRLGQKSTNPEAREASVFIHRYRSILSESFRSLMMTSPEEEEHLTDQKPSGEDMSTEDKVQMWQIHLGHQQQIESPFDPNPELIIDDDMQPEGPNGSEEFDRYAGYVLEHCSYSWLLGKLRNEVQLTNDEDGSVSKIRQEILRVMPKTTNLQSRCVRVFKTALEVLWPLRSYLKDNFDDGDQVKIGRIVTITGSNWDAQALTCEQYMEQTWPCTGSHLLKLIQQTMLSPDNPRVHCERPDGAVLEAWEADSSMMCVGVLGTSGVATEIAEQLCWLSAALRKFPDSLRLVMCAPTVNYTSSSSYLPELKIEPRYFASPGIYHFRIGFVLQDADPAHTPGLCWNQMFNQLTVVHGFPIRRRQQRHLGLEISLKVAAELVGTKYVNSLMGNLFVKGYSALLVPTLQVDDILVWHLSVHPSGQHLPYHDHEATSLQNIKIEDVSKFRHVVGWCSRASNYAGAADGHYTVRRARLPKAYTGCVLAGNVLSFGALLTSDTPHVLSKQHYTSHARRSGFSNWLRYLSQNFVLFWDKRDQKGWLVNGINALLHLVRASLNVDDRDSTGADYVLRPSDLKDPRQPHSAKAAREFLSQCENLRAKVSLSKIGMEGSHDVSNQIQDEYERLDDRVEQYCHVLEKAIKYSAKLQSLSAQNNKGKSAFRLEGWDFVDLAEKVDSVDACATTISTESHSWQELVRSVGVATFFGQGFGELIRPSTSGCCEGWNTLPAGKHYVAANVFDVKKIMDLKGNPESRPRHLSETLLWHHPATAFENCGCKEPGGAKTRLVQQPCSTQRTCECPKLYDLNLEMDDYEEGAVIFGYNPEYGPLPEVESDDEFTDSGLGSSLAETRSRSDLSTQPVQRDPTVRQYGDATVSGGTPQFGDTHNVQYIYNYGMPPYPVQQASLLTPQLGLPYRITAPSTETKRSYSDTQIATTLSGPVSEITDADGDPGPSKRARTTKRHGTWKDIMLT